jgi:hypothetical protein
MSRVAEAFRKSRRADADPERLHRVVEQDNELDPWFPASVPWDFDELPSSSPARRPIITRPAEVSRVQASPSAAETTRPAAASSRRTTGVAHVHTTFSYGGALTVRNLADVASRAGWEFMLVTAHSNGLTRHGFAALEAECQRVSHERFLMFPSVEYACDHNVHMLGYGAGYIEKAPRCAVSLAHEIRARGGLAILAHPRKRVRGDPPILTEDILSAVSGIELWNSKLACDGPWIAPVRNYELLRPGKVALCGQDAYAYRHLSSLVIQMDVYGLTRDEVLANLAEARFTMTNGVFTLRPDAPPAGAAARLARLAGGTMTFGVMQALRVRDLFNGRGA